MQVSIGPGQVAHVSTAEAGELARAACGHRSPRSKIPRYRVSMVSGLGMVILICILGPLGKRSMSICSTNGSRSCWLLQRWLTAGSGSWIGGLVSGWVRW